MRRALVGALVFAAACKAPSPPDSFGVDLTVSWAGVSTADRQRAANLVIHVGGDEQAMQTLPTSDFKGDELRVQYVPQVAGGTLDFAAALVGGDAGSIAFIDSGPVALQPGKAVPLSLMLAQPTAAGQQCSQSLQCGTAGGCVDGVCCTQSSCPPCHQCGSDGTCIVSVTNAAQPGVCDGDKLCDANGDCRGVVGLMCTAATDCASGNCADGLCCDQACNGACQTCAAGGMCGMVTLAQDADSCAINAGGALMCDAAGSCVAPHLLADLNTATVAITNTASANPSQFVPLSGGRVLFTASNNLGPALWVTDGNGGTPTLLQQYQFGNTVAELTPMGGNAYFYLQNLAGPINETLFKTDGSQVVPLLNATLVNSPHGLTVVGSTLFFSGTNAAGAELWKTDGSSAGTVLVKDILPGASNSSPFDLTAFGNSLLFAAGDTGPGPIPANTELWISDGTAAGTHLVADLSPGAGSTVFIGNAMAAVGNKAFFVANAVGNPTVGNVGPELFSTDGTAAGTVLVKDVFPGPNPGGIPGSLTAAGGTLYFTDNDGVNGQELWKSDGTAAGTVMVKDIAPMANSSGPHNLTAIGSLVYFGAITNTEGDEPWVSDGTAAGTVLLKDIATGAPNSLAGNSTPRGFTAFQGKVFFETSQGAQTLWVTDGTPAGTVLACPSGTLSMQCMTNAVAPPAVIGEHLYYPGDIGGFQYGAEPFIFP